ncbi:MAG: hypothetical protein IIT68_03255 [Treponema sp.]|nr:hypothetical protein [Treponema sp.]
MARAALDDAHSFLKRRKFQQVIELLEAHEDAYQNNFDFYMTLGTACLYLGDVGNARRYFSTAREIRLTDSNLILAQAAIFLRRGETDRALQYYLEVLDVDPSNKVAQKALDFIRKKGDYETICRWVDSGKIEEFYPPLGVNPDVIRNGIIGGLVLGAVLSVCVTLLPRQQQKVNMVGPRANLTKLELTTDESNHAQETDLSNTVVHYLMDNAQIVKSYRSALMYFQDGRDNACQVEINRILNSNASLSIKQKANILKTYLEVPTFDSLLDNYTYAQVAQDPLLYIDCYVAWSGRIANAQTFANGTWGADLLVGYETMQTVDGRVYISFDPAPQPAVDATKAVRVLGKLGLQDNEVVLSGRSVYQPMDGVSVN